MSISDFGLVVLQKDKEPRVAFEEKTIIGGISGKDEQLTIAYLTMVQSYDDLGKNN